ncbi:hypothetical protein D9737_22440, partial [Escherichia sp. E10V4]
MIILDDQEGFQVRLSYGNGRASGVYKGMVGFLFLSQNHIRWFLLPTLFRTDDRQNKRPSLPTEPFVLFDAW